MALNCENTNLFCVCVCCCVFALFYNLLHLQSFHILQYYCKLKNQKAYLNVFAISVITH